MGLSLTVSEINGDFGRKSQFFPPQCILHNRWMGSPWSWVLAHGVKKLEWCGYRAKQEVWRYLHIRYIWIQYTNVTDGRTGDTRWQQRPHLRIASRR